MSLSNVLASLPKHEAVLPASGMRVEYRPFLVKEEKVLLMAAETKDEKSIISAVREVILACTDGKVDVYTVPLVDVEYMFVQLRSKSVSETAKPNIKCSKCEKPNEVEIGLNDIHPTKDPNHKTLIPIVGNIKVQMRYPTMKSVTSIPDESDIASTFALLTKCIDRVYVGDKVYIADEIGEKEVYDFVDQLTQSQFNALSNFFVTMPRMEKEVSFKCAGCGTENKMTLRGLPAFF